MQDTIRLTPTLVALAYLLAPPQTSAFAAAASEHGPVEAISSAYPGAACGRNLQRQDNSEASDDYERLASSKNPVRGRRRQSRARGGGDLEAEATGG